jgi:Tfp pilus assembly protein PilW
MDFNPIYTKPSKNKGGTLAETLVAMGASALVLIALASILVLSGRSFVAFSNYVDLNTANRTAMDYLTRDIRECNRIIGYTASTLVIEDATGASITYYYNPNEQMLTRIQNGIKRVLLTGCESLAFDIAQRNPVEGSYDVYPAATAATAKVVNVSWNCSRMILGYKANTENVQTARIVIRRQG